MDDKDNIMDSLSREFGNDPTQWPDNMSQEYINWRAKQPTTHPETKTMQELTVELKQADQVLKEQLAAEIRTMTILGCEADVIALRTRIERLRQKDML